MRVHIKTYGCTLNQADSEIMESTLRSSGVQISDSANDADVVIVNTCTVKDITAQKILYQLSNMQKAGKRIVVTGCMAGANQDLIKRYAPSASMVTVSNIQDITDIVKDSYNGQRKVVSQYSKTDRLALFRPGDSIIAKIPTNDGCLSNCSFCETKFARGPLNSFSEKRILEAIEQSVRMGAKEVQLTSQDIGAYGSDSKTDIAELMEKITLIEGDFKVRIGMINPEHLHRCFDEFADALKNERFYKFVHLPVQSGSNTVLKDMKRDYTIEEFDGYVEELRKRMSNVTIETDIIVGFPTETQEDFDKTTNFIRRTRPEVTNISRFGARPHTQASKMKQQSVETINQRSLVLSRIVRQVQHETNDKFIDKRFNVIITESTRESLNGRNDSYRQVVINKNDADGIKVGARVNALIYAASANVLYATL